MKSRKINYTPKYVYDDYKNWEGKWELIGGSPYAMSPLPTIEHQKVSGDIYVQLLSTLKGCDKCETLLPVD